MEKESKERSSREFARSEKNRFLLRLILIESFAIFSAVLLHIVASSMPGDVTNKDDIRRIAKEIGEKEGGIHIVSLPTRSHSLLVPTIPFLSSSRFLERTDLLALRQLVNNAGISGEVTKLDKLKTAQDYSDAHLKEQTFEGWDDVFRTNATSGFMVSMAFLPLLEKFTWGRDPAGKAIYDRYMTGIINVTSISGLTKLCQNHFACTFIVALLSSSNNPPR